MKLRAKAVTALILTVASPAFATESDESDPCKSYRVAWQADKSNEVMLERWNKCLDSIEAEKEKIEAEREKHNAEWKKSIAADRAEAAARAKRPGVRIGMTADQVINRTRWGRPNTVNKTITTQGVREQWVYGDGMYLYFESGRVTTIQTSN